MDRMITNQDRTSDVPAMRQGRRLARSVALVCLVAAEAAAGGLWETDFAEAAESAKAGNRYLLLDFTGSDWCGFCIKLNNEVFEKKPFKQYAEENLVCVIVDFPNQRSLKSSLKKQNDSMKAQYGVKGFPTVIVLAPGGDVVMQKVGYTSGEEDEYLEGLKAAIAEHREKNNVPAPVAIQPKRPRSVAPPTPTVALPKAVARDENREMRTWTSQTGASVEASLVEEEGPYVILRKESGAQVQIARDSLSSEDQQYITSLSQEGAAVSRE